MNGHTQAVSSIIVRLLQLAKHCAPGATTLKIVRGCMLYADNNYVGFFFR